MPGFVPAAIVPEPPTAVTPNTGLGCAKSASSCSALHPHAGRAGVATSRSAHRKSASFVMRSRRSAASINKRTPPGAGCHLGHLCEAHELFALVEFAPEIRDQLKAQLGGVVGTPPPRTDPPPCRDRLIDTLPGARAA